MKLIVGLGNPGEKYARTRHNAGFETIDELAAKLEARWSEDARHHAEIAKTSLDEKQLLLAKPTTYMNLSGTAVQALTAYYKIGLDDILIVHDDMDIESGEIAFIKDGGAAGHNGVADIQDKMGTKNFARLRIGVGRPSQANPFSKEDWVLQRLPDPDAAAVHGATREAVEAAQDWASVGLDKAMNKWHSS